MGGLNKHSILIDLERGLAFFSLFLKKMHMFFKELLNLLNKSKSLQKFNTGR